MNVNKNLVIDGEILKIMADGEKFEFPEFKFILHNENLDLELTHVYKYHIERDYNSNITDAILVEFAIPEGYYRSWILNNKDKLEMTISNKSFGRLVTNRYKFIPMIGQENLLAGDEQNIDDSTLNKYKLKRVVGQCLNPLMLVLKSVYVSGYFHEMSLLDFYSAIMTKKLNDLTLFGQPLNYKLWTHKFDNERKYMNITIPTGTKLIKLADYLQNELYGIYLDGCNVYFTNINMEASDNLFGIYTYPLYSRDRYMNEKYVPVLDIISPSDPNLGNNEVSYAYKLGHYKIIPHSVNTINKLEEDKYNVITGLKLSLPYDITKMPYDGDTSAFSYSRCDTTSYNPDKIYADVQLDNKLINYENLELTDLDHNIFRHTALFNKYQSKLMRAKLPKVNIDFMIPGMPVGYLFPYQGGAKFMAGVLQNVTATYYVQKETNEVDILVALREVE